jgi:uncharacterized protein (UPF0264 family)
MIVHGLPMKTPKYTEEQQMESTMLRRSIKDGKTLVDNVSEKLGYEFEGYGAYNRKGSERVGG